ncbi:MAG: HNH endonuclease, partial [Lachnospiraceae bacterium]
ENYPDVDLDCEQNIVSLCSNCHNLLHYGVDNEELLHLIYEQRKDLLSSIGITISFDELKRYY